MFSIIDQTFEDPGREGKEKVREIAEEIASSRLDIAFAAHVRTENWRESDRGLLSRLREVGLVGVFPGLEASSAATLSVFRKPSRKEDHERALHLFRAVGLAIDVGWIMFHPHSTLEEIGRSIDFIEAMRLAHLGHVFMNRLQLYPGTEMVRKLTEDGLLVEERVPRSFSSSLAYRFASAQVAAFFEHVFGAKGPANLHKSLKLSHRLSLEWGILTSIATLKLLDEKSIRPIVQLTRERMEEAFARIGQRNAMLIRSCLEREYRGWRPDDSAAIDKECLDGLLSSCVSEFEKIKLKLLMQLSREGLLDRFPLSSRWRS